MQHCNAVPNGIGIRPRGSSLAMSLLCSRSLLRISHRVATYYTKPKPKKKTSGQAWALFAGVSTVVAGAAVYTLGMLRSRIRSSPDSNPGRIYDL